MRNSIAVNTFLALSLATTGAFAIGGGGAGTSGSTTNLGVAVVVSNGDDAKAVVEAIESLEAEDTSFCAVPVAIMGDCALSDETSNSDQ